MAGSYHPMVQDMRAQYIAQGYNAMAQGLSKLGDIGANAMMQWGKNKEEIDYMSSMLGNVPPSVLTPELMDKFQTGSIGAKRGIFTQTMAEYQRQLADQQWNARHAALSGGGGGGAGDPTAEQMGGMTPGLAAGLAAKARSELNSDGKLSLETMQMFGKMGTKEVDAFNKASMALDRMSPPPQKPEPQGIPVHDKATGTLLGYDVGGTFIRPPEPVAQPQQPSVGSFETADGRKATVYRDAQGKEHIFVPPDSAGGRQAPAGLSPGAPPTTQATPSGGTPDPMAFLFTRPQR